MAKSYNNLWGRMVDLDNIKAAIHAAAKGKRYKRSVRTALARIDKTAMYIKGLLDEGKWRPPAIRQSYAYKDGVAQKERIIVHPDFTEQVVHHLLIDYIIEPIFKPTFYRWSCGSVPGRGQEGMAKYIRRMAKKHPEKMRYHVEIDVRKCFDTISTDAIFKAVSAKIRDKKVLGVVGLILEANELKLPDGGTRKGGVPIGLYTSPWFVNIVLSRADHYLKDDCSIFMVVRFIDDFGLVGPNRRQLEKAGKGIGEYLIQWGMKLKEKGGAVPAVKSFRSAHGHKARFTGFHFNAEGRLQVRDKIYVRSCRLGAQMRKAAKKRRVSAFVASKMISYGGRFRAFGAYAAFPAKVLKGIKFYALRQKVSAKAKLHKMREVA